METRITLFTFAHSNRYRLGHRTEITHVYTVYNPMEAFAIQEQLRYMYATKCERKNLPITVMFIRKTLGTQF